MKLHMLVIAGTTRQSRMSRKVAEWYISEARSHAPDVEFELLDLAELDLPFFSEPIDPITALQTGKYTKLQQELAARIDAADGFVVVTGEYNHGTPAALKNFLDYLPPKHWRRKAAAYVGYGVRGGYWSVGDLLPTMSYLEVMTPVDATINIKLIWEAFDGQGKLKPGYSFGKVNDQLDVLLWWASALKAAREKE